MSFLWFHKKLMLRLFIPCIIMGAMHQRGDNHTLFIKAHNETNPKSNCAEKPCVTGASAKRKSTIVSDTFVSKLSCLFGGDGGNRTPVRKRFDRNFSGRRRLFTFPHPGASRHARGLGSFIVHGALKALRTHVHHWSTLHPGPWSSRVERSLIKQREEQVLRCSLIYKMPILWMVGASARYSCLHTPVETSASPYNK